MVLAKKVTGQPSNSILTNVVSLVNNVNTLTQNFNNLEIETSELKSEIQSLKQKKDPITLIFETDSEDEKSDDISDNQSDDTLSANLQFINKEKNLNFTFSIDYPTLLYGIIYNDKNKISFFDIIKPTESGKNKINNISILTCIGDFEGYNSINIDINNFTEILTGGKKSLVNTATVTLVQL